MLVSGGEEEPSYTAGENVNKSATTMETSMEFLKKTKNRLTL
jgi:hypothetical protein